MALFKKKQLKKEDQYTQKFGTRLINLVEPKHVVSEQVRMIKTNIEFAAVARKKMKTILVTSPEMSDGKSMVSANLAVSWAQAGKKVLFIDADLRRPTLHATFDMDNFNGLTTTLSGQIKLTDVIQETVIDGLNVITSGPVPPNPSELLGSEAMSNLLAWAEANYDIIMIDTPPITMVTDAQILAAKVDGVVLVVRYGKTQKASTKRAIDLIKHVESNLLGVVGRSNAKDSAGYGYGYGYGEIETELK